MFSALLYLQFQSVKNRLWERLRRLRRPRYFFGALAGGFYLLMVFGRPLFMGHPAGGAGGHLAMTPPIPEVPGSVWEFVTALVLALAVFLMWFLPQQRAALVFSEAEIAFLFPAPIRRRTLIQYKLVRSQLALLFTGSFFLLFMRWSGGWEGALMRVVGAWLVLSTISLHTLGASFARTLLLERGVTTWQRRAGILALLLGLGLGAAWWARGLVPALGPADTESLGAFARYVQTVADTPPAHWLLLPFRLVVRPVLASGDGGAFLAVLWPALALLAAHYLWVMYSDVAFEEASIGASQRHAVRVAAMRSGNWQNTRPARKRRAPFQLAPTGPPAVAILWKNLLGAGQFFNARLMIAVLAWAAIAGTSFGSAGGARTAWPSVVGVMCIFLFAMALLMGPQLVRQDFRRDLAVADLLKIYPIPGWQLALGELLAPTVILTVVQWGLIVLAVTLLHGHAPTRDFSGPTLPYGLAAAILCPAFNFVSLLIPNAAALLLPAWFASPNTPGAASNSRGIEVIGQRILFMLAQLVALAAALLPAAGIFSLVYFFVAGPRLPASAALPLAAGVSALVFVVEAVIGLLALGRLFEKYDLSVEKL